MTNGQDQRLYYLDAVRALALLLGVVFHAGLSFMPIFIGWAVMDTSTSYAVAIFVFISHTFRMPLFFLIAGYFTCMALKRTDNKRFIVSRLTKLALPLLVGWIILRPLIVAGWVAGGQSMRGDIDFAATIGQSLEVFSALPTNFLIGTHLWFLYYLLLVTGTVLALRSLASVFELQKTQWLSWLNRLLSANPSTPVNTVKSRVSSATRFMVKSILCIVPTAACLWFMNGWGIDTPDQSLAIHWPAFLLYLGWFLVGYTLYANQTLFMSFTNISVVKGLLGIVALGISLVLTEYEMQQGHPDYLWLKALFCLCYAVVMWTLVPVTISVCRRLFSTKRQWVRYVADASYWMYLIHLPIVVWLQIAVAELEYHWAIKWLSVCGLTVAISLVTYSLMVKHTFIGKVLKGKVAY
ncbi:acyltransferase family protein [Alteromonas gracilis]|uniref:acyltransferase family protein n=1 Tax=Alteromonas gracilis TaxID=1479524 RepID=UPI0030D55759